MKDLNGNEVKEIREVKPSNFYRGVRKGFAGILILIVAGLGIGGTAYLLGSNSNSGQTTIVQQSTLSSLNINAIDALDKEGGNVYLAGDVTVIGSKTGKLSGSLTADSTPTVISLNPKEMAQVYTEPTGYYGNSESVTANDLLTNVEVENNKFATPEFKVKDIESDSWVGTWDAGSNTLNIPNPNLVAGGASKTYKIMAKVSGSNTQFGDTGLFLAANAKTSKYDIGSTMASLGSNGLTDSMTDDNMKVAFKPSMKSLSSSSGLSELGTVTIKLKSGQSADSITFELYDQSKFLSKDGKSIKDGVELDDTSNSDNGADNPKIVFANS